MAEKAEILVASLKAETLHLRAELDSLRWSFEDVLKLEVSAQTGSSDILPTSSHVGYSRWETALQQQKPKKGVRVYVRVLCRGSDAHWSRQAVREMPCVWERGHRWSSF